MLFPFACRTCSRRKMTRRESTKDIATQLLAKIDAVVPESLFKHFADDDERALIELTSFLGGIADGFISRGMPVLRECVDNVSLTQTRWDSPSASDYSGISFTLAYGGRNSACASAKL